MIMNGKTGAQQWIENFHRQRKHTLLTRLKQIVDFVNALYSVIIEIKLQTLELLPVKGSRKPGEIPALGLSVSPMVNISFGSCLKSIRYRSNLYRYYTLFHYHRSSIGASEPFTTRITSDHSVQNVDVFQNVNTLFPHSFLSRIYRGDDTIQNVNTVYPYDRIDNVRVLNPVLTRIFAVDRLMNEIRKMTPAAVSPEGESSLNPVQGLRAGENVYMYDIHHSASLLSRDKSLKPHQNRGPVPFARVYPYRRQAPVTVESIDTDDGSAVISTILRIHKYTSNRFGQNMNKMISNALFTFGYKPSGRFSPGETTIIPSAVVNRRLDIHHVFRAAEEMDFKVDRHTHPRHREVPHEFLSKPVPAALELVTKKIKKIEKQIDIEEVEKTIYKKVSEQVDQTVHRDIDKRLAFQSRDTRQLTETIYSRLVNRIVLEKERLI